jgi:glycosyltransferase involved in cell wall biosynthesis
MAAAINRLLDDQALRHRLGQAGRLRARQEFSVETMTNRTMAVYADSAQVAASMQGRSSLPREINESQ